MNQGGPVYYRGLAFGSQRIFNPLTVLLNTGFDVFQFPNHDIRFFRYPFAHSGRRVGRALTHPFSTISQRKGWERFITSEILPLRFTAHDAAWVPNYALHLVGLGQTYAALDEFYRAHGVPVARPLAAATALSAGILNEMTESNGGDFPPSPEMIADLYVFNVGGVILFSSDAVRRFFADKLLLTDWSAMPVFAADGTLRNTGQFFAVKIPLPGVERTRLFARLGLSAILGLSYARGDGSAWSAGLGATGVRHVIDSVTAIESIDLDWTAGVFYDRGNSLLMSLLWAHHTRNVFSLNLYPGLLPGPVHDVGVWLAVDDAGRPRLGLISGALGGIGVGKAW